MKKEWIKWTASMALGLLVIAAGCGDKKGESSATPPAVGAAPSAPPENTGLDSTVQPGAGAEQSPSGMNKAPETGSERKSQPR